ncbi:hypothetical protein GGI09_005471 [Coemansia sp. S100]|nr:hypothetical protein LPJ71_006306 [Coemansia sp. S17]KAJ2094317.1 hypothetical protein GGI09_005471 [Coemansia sp. S100]
MSFAFTPEEQLRVTLAQLAGIKLDPIGYVDLSTVIVVGTIYALQFIAVTYQLYNRNYPPLGVKNVPLMASLYFGGLAWFFGDLFTSGIVHLSHSPVLRSCKFTLIWLRACLGAYYVAAMFSLRCFSLYYVFYKGKAFKGTIVYVSVGITVLSIALFGIISTVIPTHLTTHYEPLIDMCNTNRNYIIAVVVVVWSIASFTAVMSWRMRNVPFCFNERIEMFTSFVVLIIAGTLNTICLLGIKVYPASLGWRTGLVYANHASISIGYWVIMGEATYNCIFDREGYLQYWINTLKELDMERQYAYNVDNEITLNLVEYTDPTSTMVNDGPTHNSDRKWLENAIVHSPVSPSNPYKADF